MYRRFVKAFEPVKIQLTRAVGGNSAAGEGASAGTQFQQNCVSKEQHLSEALRRTLPGITYMSVQDISGGCGAMFEISVEAKEFVGLNRVKQHQLVTDSLKSEIAEMHGIRIHTSPTPAASEPPAPPTIQQQ